jgi:hypothetical protein
MLAVIELREIRLNYQAISPDNISTILNETQARRATARIPDAAESRRQHALTGR